MCEASRPTFCIHISGAHRGARKNHLFRPLVAFLFLFLVRCPYSPYDLVIISREIVYFRAKPRNLRAKILCAAREDSSTRESPPESSFFPRALYDFARDCQNFARSGKRLRARLYNFARSAILFRADCRNFARDPATTTLFFLASILRVL